jgi:AraC-like DNA-binding protein
MCQALDGKHARFSSKYPSESEMDRIIREIRNLIGEKNRYREKMLTITPYAQTGMLHGVLTGNIENDTIRILIEENFMDLIKPYFIVSVVNYAFHEQMTVVEKYYTKIQEIVKGACKLFSTEEIHIVCYNRDIYNTFLIVNFENDEPMDDLFFRVFNFIQENVKKYKCVVTIGVAETKCNINELKDACEEALSALDEMIIGGRGTVYFNEAHKDSDTDYYFPRNFTERMTKYISKGRIDEIRKMLGEIYEKNVNMGGPPEMYHALVDELHISVIKALKEVTDLNSVHVNIEKIKMLATLEEIFNYYEKALESVIDTLKQTEESQAGNKELEKRILEFLEENYCNPDLSLQYLTEYFNVSSKYISLFCKKYFNTTYFRYIQNKRIAKAVELIRTGKYSLAEISDMCGYTNLLTFRRNFKSVTGVNPSDFT